MYDNIIWIIIKKIEIILLPTRSLILLIQKKKSIFTFDKSACKYFFDIHIFT